MRPRSMKTEDHWEVWVSGREQALVEIHFTLSSLWPLVLTRQALRQNLD